MRNRGISCHLRRRFPSFAHYFCTAGAAAASARFHNYHQKQLRKQDHYFNSNPVTDAERELISLIKSSTRKSHLLQIHTHLIRKSHLVNTKIFLHFLSRISLPPLKDLQYGIRIFQHYPEPNVSLYGVMIRAHSLSEDDSASLGFMLYKEMLQLGFPSDRFCLLSAVKCCVKMGSFSSGLQLQCRILKDGYNSDSILLTTLMEFYSLNGKGFEACIVFDEISNRDTTAWNVLLSCFLRNKRSGDSFTAFEIMEKSTRFQPDDISCLLLLEACGKLNALEFGERIHDYIKEHGFADSKKIQNSLVNMYSRCGRVDKAYEIFIGLPDKDVVTWSSMILGLASNGYGRQAIEAFKEMQKLGVAPDDQTCTAVLSGCSKSGLVDEGRMFFNFMTQELGIVPNIYHYGCIVDMLSRSGLLDEAYELICSMRVKPDATIWRTLLGACRHYRHAVLGEKIVEHLIEMKAEEAGDYVLLVNIYSSLNNVEKVKEVRKLMKEKGLHIKPACSTIEYKGKVHEFEADDVSHPRKKEIYTTLDEINHQLKIAGYVAEITTEFSDPIGDGEEKRRTKLSYHSEKLAIAFGILVTPPGTKIHLAKDLQVCLDCHNFAKMVSGVYNRQVVIRDCNRFHHFREGRCSCDDYW